MKTHYIYTDVDGIYRDHGGDLDPEAKEALKLLFAHGYTVIPCSGKPLDYQIEYFTRHNLIHLFPYIIAEEGGIIYDATTGERTYATRHMDDLGKFREVIVSRCTNLTWYDKPRNFRSGSAELDGIKVEFEAKETGFCLFAKEDDLEKIGKIYNEIVADHSFNLTSIIHPDAAAVLRKDASKTEGILKVAKILDLNIAKAAAIGDGLNDKEMLSDIGIPLSVGNGHELIKMIVRDRNGYVAKQEAGKGFLEATKWLIANR